jgi:bacteriocin-like protein
MEKLSIKELMKVKGGLSIIDNFCTNTKVCQSAAVKCSLKQSKQSKIKNDTTIIGIDTTKVPNTLRICTSKSCKTAKYKCTSNAIK